MKRKIRCSNAAEVADRRPVNRQAAVVTSSSAKRIGVVVPNQSLQNPRDEDLLPIPDDGVVSLRSAARCRFVPKAVIFRGERRWIDPMDWENAFDAALAMLEELHVDSMQFIDDRYLGTELLAGIEPQWTYCYCLRNICRFLEIDYDEIEFLAFVKRIKK